MKRIAYLAVALLALAACKKDPSGPQKISVTGISVTPSALSLKVGETGVVTAEISPSNATDKTLVWTSSDNAVATVSEGTVSAVSPGEAIITVMAMDGSGVKANCGVTVQKAVTPVPDGAVDLGLGVYWATCNLGASKPEGFGGYYSWGETEIKDYYSWDRYKFGSSESGPFSKYNAIDKNTTLDTGPAGDDVVSKLLGGRWRMPTYAECQELVTKCTWTWIDNYSGTGVAGRKATAPNGNSIFLPAFGYKNKNGVANSGTYGYYWSSSLVADKPSHAWQLYLTPYETTGVKVSELERYLGCTIRPVSD